MRLTKHQQDLLDRGLARVYRGRLIPVMSGGDGTDEEPENADALFPVLPEDIAEWNIEDLEAFVAEAVSVLDRIADDPTVFVTAEYSADDLIADARETLASLKRARTTLAELAPPATPEAEVAEPEDTAALTAELADIATLAREDEDEQPEPQPEPTPTPEPAPQPEPEPAPPETAAIARVAAAPLRRPPRSQRPVRPARPRVAITAAAGAPGVDEGTPFANDVEVAEAMVARRRQFGVIASGTKGEKLPIARSDWRDVYPRDRVLGGDVLENMGLLASVLDPSLIRAEMDRRKEALDDGSVVAAGTICAPLAPYYDLQSLSTADRPVRAGLASFGADRGGVRFAPPPRLSAVTTGVGSKTAVDDAAGGTFEVKTCQEVVCPAFQDAEIGFIYHCLEFKNLTARVFPEMVAHWNGLTLAAQARLAETQLLSAIAAASTAVTANNNGLGISGSLPGQLLAARAGMISRHRMSEDTVMRVLLPSWSISLFISDVVRSQFQRFDTDRAKVIAMLRSWDIEPSFYVDGATGAGQVFGTQGAGALLAFPSTLRWYMFPEGSFLFLDGGTMELGVVRDSTLNSTNNYQIFGESFEGLAFVGIESLAVASAVCDSGVVAQPGASECPQTY